MCAIHWGYLAAMLTAAGTFGIAFAAFHQLGKTLQFNIQRDTLEKCLMYETNPLIAAAVQEFKSKRYPLNPEIGAITCDNYKNAIEYERSIVIVLNYLDALGHVPVRGVAG